MATYRLLKELYELTEGINETTGVKVFLEDDDDTESLPVALEAFDPTHAGCKCINRKKSIYGKGETVDPNRFKWTCNYTTNFKKNTDLDKRMFTAGGETLTVNPEKSDVWYYSSSVSGAEADVQSPISDQKIFRTIIRGTFSRTFYVLDDNFSDMVDNINSMLGRINDSPWEAPGAEQYENLWSTGMVMFSSATGSMTTSRLGNEVWEFTLNFIYKIIPGITQNSWQFTWNSKKQGATATQWQVPTSKPYGTLDPAGNPDNLLYKWGDFTTLYAYVYDESASEPWVG